ncbi:protein impaired in BABA-induced sterility 1, partial [Tanacetum coccineum]
LMLRISLTLQAALLSIFCRLSACSADLRGFQSPGTACLFSAAITVSFPGALLVLSVVISLPVEQLHRIFKLCGTPPDDYWNKSKLPLATRFKPHHAYESTLYESRKDIPKTALNLIETFLLVDPCKRGTATSALEYIHSVLNDNTYNSK